MEQRSELVSGLLPQLYVDELLGELQSRLQAVLGTRDRMNGCWKQWSPWGQALTWKRCCTGSPKPLSVSSARGTARWA